MYNLVECFSVKSAQSSKYLKGWINILSTCLVTRTASHCGIYGCHYASSFSFTSEAQEWGGRPGEGSPIVNWPFQMNREVKERRREEDKRVPLPLQNKRDAPPEKDRPARAHIDLQGSPHTTPN